MRQRVVNLHLDHLGIDHDEAKLLRGEAVEHAGDDGIDADALAGAGGAGDEAVRHLREIGDDRVAVNVLAERDAGFWPWCCAKSSVSSSSRRPTFILRELAISMPTVSLPGMGARMLMRSARVARAMSRSRLSDLVHAHALGRVDLVAGDGGAAGDIAGSDADAELGERLDDDGLDFLSSSGSAAWRPSSSRPSRRSRSGRV